MSYKENNSEKACTEHIKGNGRHSTCSTGGRDEKSTRNFKQKSRRRKTTRVRHRLKDNIKRDLIEVRQGDVDWIHLTQDGAR
jgi:hypothetical protein